jgi:hypothetical protein
MNNTPPNIGLFDLDGSLADYNKAMLAGLHELKTPEEPEFQWPRQGEDIAHVRARIDLIMKQPDWWLNLEQIPTGFQILELAKSIGFEIHVLTQGPRNKPVAWKEKVEWCQKHLGSDIDIHITRNKGLVYGKFLYDDYPEYMLKWLEYRPRGLGIMPANPENQDFKHPQVVKWDGTNLEEVSQRLRAAYERLPGEALVV